MKNIEPQEKVVEELRHEIDYLKKEIADLKEDKNEVGIIQKEKDDYHASQIRFRTIFETSGLGNKVISSDLTIMQVNSALVKLLGYDRKEEIIGTRILDYAPSEFHSHWELLQNKLWALQTPSFSLETCLKKKDGTIIWCQINSILFIDQGETLGYTIIEDITAQNQLKKQRENFISIASHELKTPLTSLQASLQVMHRMIEKDTEITDKLKKMSESSKRSISKLSALVGDLLDSNKISRGHLKLDISTFTVAELVAKCCSHVRADGKHEIIYKGDQSLTISADEQKIDQVLVNLVNNAVKYAPESRDIVVSLEDLDDCVKISIIDGGKGISEDKIPFLFDSYYQVEQVGNQKEGLGLGLYISAEIVKNHNGEIGVNSEVGKGSTFWFTLPKNLQ